jgi:hypothetical protein
MELLQMSQRILVAAAATADFRTSVIFAEDDI